MLLLPCLLLGNIIFDGGALDIAAFNVRIFGQTKMDNPDVRYYLTKIILRYDLILIQEIRDASGTAILDLLKDVNSKSSSVNYNIKISPRLGRTTSKEQYAFIYREDWLEPTDFYTYNDVLDVFEREPFVVRFKNTLASINDFAVVGIHTSPGDAQNEISNLTSVYDDILLKWKLVDVIIMGDFNGGCRYVSQWDNVKLATDRRFYWIIDNTVDTTTENSECPYDRIVVAGTKLIEAILPLSGGAFRYNEAYDLTRDQMLKISDHYPVAMQIRPQIEANNTGISKVAQIKDKRVEQIASSVVYNMRRRALKLPRYSVSAMYTKTGACLQITVRTVASSAGEVIEKLFTLHEDFSNLVTLTQYYVARRSFYQVNLLYSLPKGFGRYQTLYDFYKTKNFSCSIQLVCDLTDRTAVKCWVEVTKQQI